MLQVKKVKITAILIVIIAVLLGSIGIWRLWPQIRFKYGYLFSHSLIRPIGNDDNVTKLTTILSQANLAIVTLEEVNNTSVVASLSGEVKVTFSLEKDLSSQVATLQVILGRFRIEGRKVHRIDLRFNNAVVE